MAKKTNKTSHVMDLLTNGASSESGTSSASPEAPSSPEKKGDVQSHTVTPKKVTVVDEGSRNDRLSSEILNKLSEELEQEQDQEISEISEPADIQNELNDQTEAMPQSEADEQSEIPSEPEEPAKEPAEPLEELPLPTEIAGEEAEPIKDSQEEPASSAPNVQEMPSQEEISSAPKTPPQMILPPSQINDHINIKEYHFVNVMERLIMRQNMDSFFEQYGVCRCERCVADVYALALTGLPSKYVVTTKDSLSPILSYYESKYKIYMLTEIIKACNRVRESPRHKS